jgi:hypothetical protein
VTGIIEHKDMVMWKDAHGRWVVRSTAAPIGVVYRSGARSSGAEAIRRRLWGRARRRDTDELPPAVIGNCGRPLQEECGLLDPNECATHAKAAGGWDGLNPGDEDTWTGRHARLQRRIARARRRNLDAPLQAAGDTTAEQLLKSAQLRAKHNVEKPSAALVAADCAFRMRVW